MGLFSSKKNLCPICGEPTPKLFPTKIEDTPICKECASKIDLPDGMINSMTLAAFQEYLLCYDENKALRDIYKDTYVFNPGFFSSGVSVDVENRLIRPKSASFCFVFTAEEFTGFKITEDNRVLFEGDANGLRCYQSDVDTRLQSLEVAIADYNDRMREYERMEELERLRDMVTDDKDDNRYRRTRFRPTFNIDEPVKEFHIYLEFNHPYWKSYSQDFGSPKFDHEHPSTYTYKTQYDEKVRDLRELAEVLKNVIAPNAPISEAVNAVPAGQIVNLGALAAAIPVVNKAPAANVDAVAEIKKYKELLDAGIITDEEFSAKKRQLLGI